MRWYRRFLPYGVAVGSTAIALLLNLRLATLDTRSLFYIAVALSTWCGGLRPGLVATALSLLAIGYCIPLAYQIQITAPEDVYQFLLFVGVSLIITLLTTHLQASHHTIEQLNRQLIDESTDRLRIALHAAQMGLWNWNIKTNQIDGSPEYEQLFGFLPGTFDGTYDTFNACLHPDDREGQQQALARSLRERLPYRHEYRIIGADGSIHWIEGRGEVTYDAAGQPAQMVGTVMDITSRKHAEIVLEQVRIELEHRVTARTAELQQSNDLLTSFFNAASSAAIGLSIHDHNLRFVQINEALAAINGHPVANHLGKTTTELLPELALTVNPLLQQVLATGQPLPNLEVVSEVPSQPGCLRYWLASYFPIFDRNGSTQTIGVGVIVVEISDRQRTADALRISQSRLAGMLDNASDAIVAVDADRRVTLFNQGAEKIFGYLAHEIMGRPLNLLLPNHYLMHHQSVPIDHPTANAQRIGEQIEVLGCRKDGTTFPAEASISRLDLGSEQIFTAFLRDITERKQSESALAQLASIVESSGEAIISKSLEGIVISWNASAERLFGYSAEEMIGRSITHIIPADRLDEETQILEQAKRGTPIQRYDTVRQRKDGALIDTAVTISPIKDAAGNVISISKIAHDITERRTVERMKNEFISIVSHELRTPLTSIRGSLGLLATGVMDDEPAEMKRMIDIAAIDTERLVRLVNEVLDLERLESGRVTLVREWCNVADLMQRSSEVMHSSAQEAGVQLVVSPLSEQIWVAPDRIIQTLTNLLSNAIKFSAPGGTVTVSAEVVNQPLAGGLLESETIGRSEPPKPHARLSLRIPPFSYLLFSVQDQGRGIPADKLDAIFDRFQQVDASDSRDKGGTGLGLAICKSIVQQHEGQIWAESCWGQGSTFFFTLPLHAG